MRVLKLPTPFITPCTLDDLYKPNPIFPEPAAAESQNGYVPSLLSLFIYSTAPYAARAASNPSNYNNLFQDLALLVNKIAKQLKMDIMCAQIIGG
jgi:hypothetical protein